MELVTLDEFLGWAGGMGLALQPREDEPPILAYQADAHAVAVVHCPGAAEDVLQFLANLFDCLEDWKACWVVKRVLPWTFQSLDGVVNCVRVDIMQGLGIPEGFGGVLHFNKADFSRLAALLFSEVCFGRGKADELFVVPNHGHQMVHFKHDDCAYIHTITPDRLETFLQEIAAKGIIATAINV